MRRVLATLVVVAAVLLSLPVRPAPAAPGPQSVYVNLADSLQGGIDGAVTTLRGAFEARGWRVLATHEVGADRKACSSRAVVLVLDDPAYTSQVLARGARAAFALPPRVVLYEDEAGLHLATVNPLSLNRTVLAESGFEAPSEKLLDELSRTAAGALHGRFARRPYGQVRSRGLIGRTMGVMAGGPFLEKLHDLALVPGDTPADVQRVADLVAKGLGTTPGKGRWQLHAVYRQDLPTAGVTLFGVSGAAMEAKAFAIVGAGGDDRRSGYKCAGLAHGAAFPIELVVYAVGGQVHVAAVEAMYRMKVFFEDAGKMKFAANMGMPGSIEDEMRALVQAGVGTKR